MIREWPIADFTAARSIPAATSNEPSASSLPVHVLRTTAQDDQTVPTTQMDELAALAPRMTIDSLAPGATTSSTGPESPQAIAQLNTEVAQVVAPYGAAPSTTPTTTPFLPLPFPWLLRTPAGSGRRDERGQQAVPASPTAGQA